MKRRDWQPRLSAWARARIGAPFQWGLSDCAILCAEAVDAMTGSTHARSLRGAWGSQAQALRFQRRTGSLVRGLLLSGCFPLKPVVDWMPGDIIVAERDGFIAGHVCLGDLSLSSLPGLGVCLCETRLLRVYPGSRALRLP
jgi:hypothetical protein